MTPPDPIIFATLVLIVFASAIIFFVSVRRETTHRGQLRLAEWAQAHRFRTMSPEFGPPRPVDRVTPPMSLTLGLFDHTTRLVHLRSTAPDAGDPPVQWNFAIRHLATRSPAVGLRSADAARSVVDLLGLEPSPRQTAGGRFTVVGEDVVASARLADGSSRALLPGDLSLLRVDEFLVLDFSTRPFDPIELGRMIGLLDQMATVA